MWVFYAFREIRRGEGRVFPTGVYESFAIKNRLGKFCVQRRSVRPLSVSRALYEGKVAVPASTVAYGTAAATRYFCPVSRKSPILAAARSKA